MQSGVPAHTDSMPVRLHHIVVDAHDLPGLARFWTQALGWKVLSEREREIVIGTDENAPVGMCFMPVTDLKTVKNRLHLDLTSSAQDRDQEIERLVALGARRVGTPLKLGLNGQHSARRGGYRVIYRIDGQHRRVDVVAIEHRSDIHRPRQF